MIDFLQRTLREKELAGQKNKISKLENLCRALQAERNALLGKARSLEGKYAQGRLKLFNEKICIRWTCVTCLCYCSLELGCNHFCLKVVAFNAVLFYKEM